jgi:hypothetical protein
MWNPHGACAEDPEEEPIEDCGEEDSKIVVDLMQLQSAMGHLWP